jgi:hypothetical protein
VEKVCSEGVVPCGYNSDWPDFSTSVDSVITGAKGFDTFINTHNDRELRNLGALRVKKALREEWDCATGTDARRRNGSSLIHGIQWPPLQELRAKFIQRHGPQEWLHPELERWSQPNAFIDRHQPVEGAPGQSREP